MSSLFAPICVFTDFGAALPSLIHKWLFVVRRSSGLLAGLTCFIEGIYATVNAVGELMLKWLKCFSFSVEWCKGALLLACVS